MPRYTKAQKERMARWASRWWAQCFNEVPPRHPNRELHARAYGFWMERTDPLLSMDLDALYANTEAVLAKHERA
jgi:hypothetical protein